MIKQIVSNHPEMREGDLWIFGYASLMWNPGFVHSEIFPARIFGFHRALCVRSWVHRGTPERPGLVFGLDIGGSCVGRGLCVPRTQKNKVLDYLKQRELATGVYKPRVITMHMDGRRLKGLAFVTCRNHRQYVRGLSVEREAEIVCAGSGPSGANRDYVLNTVDELERLGIRDQRLLYLKSLLEDSGGVGRRA